MIIQIPGKITFSRTHDIPPIQVELPLQARARTFWGVAMTVIWVCSTLFVLLFWLGIVISVRGGDPLPSITLLCFLAILSLKLVFLMPKAILGIAGLTRRDPALILDAQGLTDRRTGISIPWSSVVSAQSVQLPMDTGIRLALRGPVPPRGFLFDRGGGKILGIRRPDEYILRPAFLSVPYHVLTETVWALVRLNGGTAKT